MFGGIRRNQVQRPVATRGTLWPRRILLCVFYASLLLAISACSFESAKKTSNTPEPPKLGAKPIQKMAAMPTVMDTFRAIAKPQGLKFVRLFDDPVENSDARIKRLEDAVQQLRNDFDTILPTMVSLASIEKDIKGLVSQLQTLTGEAPPPSDNDEELQPFADPQTAQPIPGEDVVEGTETAGTPAGTEAPSSPVTPEAASEGELPPEGAASPNSSAPVDLMNPPAAIKPVPFGQIEPIVPEATPPATEDMTEDMSALQPPKIPAPSSDNAPSVAPQPEQKAGVESGTPEAASQPPLMETVANALGDVKDVRIADHSDKTRLVLDMTSGVSINAEMINDGMTLVIDASRMNWRSLTSWVADSGNLIAGYRLKDGKLHVDVIYPSTIKMKQTLSPAAGSADYRLVIDLFSPEVHQ